MLNTVAELSEYQRRAEKLLTQAERNELAKLVKVLIKTALGD